MENEWLTGWDNAIALPNMPQNAWSLYDGFLYTDPSQKLSPLAGNLAAEANVPTTGSEPGCQVPKHGICSCSLIYRAGSGELTAADGMLTLT